LTFFFWGVLQGVHDGTLDGAVKKHRKQYHKVLKADPYFKDIAARSADNAHIKGKHPVLKDDHSTGKLHPHTC
jgi:hypothetical protein